jgi:hypothetical protein
MSQQQDDVRDAQLEALRAARRLLKTFHDLPESGAEDCTCKPCLKDLEARYPYLVTDIEHLDAALERIRFVGGLDAIGGLEP